MYGFRNQLSSCTTREIAASREKELSTTRINQLNKAVSQNGSALRNNCRALETSDSIYCAYYNYTLTVGQWPPIWI